VAKAPASRSGNVRGGRPLRAHGKSCIRSMVLLGGVDSGGHALLPFVWDAMGLEQSRAVYNYKSAGRR